MTMFREEKQLNRNLHICGPYHVQRSNAMRMSSKQALRLISEEKGLKGISAITKSEQKNREDSGNQDNCPLIDDKT
jgi:hypothetical protein